MKKPKRFILIFLNLLWLGSSQTFSQETLSKKQYDDIHFWTSINSTSRFSDRWGMVADFHLRRENFMKEPNFYFGRLGAAYWINNQFSFVAGGAALWLATDTEAGLKYALERRTYQQFLWREKISRITFLQRIRIEQRWHEVLRTEDGKVDRVRYSNRFRFLLSGKIKLFEKEKLPSLVLSDEILFHTGEEIIFNTFDQNRLFIGFNQRLGKNFTMDYGYMMVYQQRYSGFEYNMNHTVRLFFYYTPDFRKKEGNQLQHYPVGGLE